MKVEGLSKFLKNQNSLAHDEILKYKHVYKNIPKNNKDNYDCGVYTIAYMQNYVGEDVINLDLSTVSNIFTN